MANLLSMAFPNKQPNFCLSSFPFRYTAANEFQSTPAPKKNLLLDYIFTVEVENINSIEDSTHKGRKRTWKRWIAWLAIVGWDGDPFLTRLTDAQNPRMVGGVIVSIRRGERSHDRYTDPLVGDTVAKALSDLAKTFRKKDKQYSRHNMQWDTHIFLKAILQSFQKTDPRENPQKAATQMLLAHLYKQGKLTFIQHIADLCNKAIFFACRPCKYAATTDTRKNRLSQSHASSSALAIVFSQTNPSPSHLFPRKMTWTTKPSPSTRHLISYNVPSPSGPAS